MRQGNELIDFYKKIVEPIVAVSVLILLIWIAFSLVEDNKLKEKIADNCGYETKNYVCYCEKKFVDDMKTQIENYNNPNGGLNFNASLDG